MLPAPRRELLINNLNFQRMYEQFIELTNQIYWEGYAEILAKEDPEKFRMELNDFLTNYEE